MAEKTKLFGNIFRPFKNKTANDNVPFDNDLQLHIHGRNRPWDILLFGAESSGKSTLLTQFRILFSDRVYLDTETRAGKRSELLRQTLDAVVLVCGRRNENGELSRELEQLHQELEAVLESWPNETLVHMTEEIANKMKTLISSPMFQNLIESERGNSIPDGYPYFLQKFMSYPQWGGPNWIPTKEDILHQNSPTSDYCVSPLLRVDGFFCQMFDVSGSRNLRDTYLVDSAAQLKGIHAVIFVHALNDYDQTFQYTGESKLKDSLNLWDKTFGQRVFSQSSFVLVFNKFDLFFEKYKVKKIPLNPEAGFLESGPPKADQDNNECEMAQKWYKELFLSRIPQDRRDSVYVKFLNAFDELNCQRLLERVVQNLHI